MAATNARVANWMEGYLREPAPHEGPSLWDRLPRDVRERILLFERHWLARHMIQRWGIAFRGVQNRSVREFDQIDFSHYVADLEQSFKRARSKTRTSARITSALREQLVAVSFAVPWLAEASQRDLGTFLRNHGGSHGPYAHLSWLRWKDRDAWPKCPETRRQMGDDGISMEAFEKRKIHFEGLDLACSGAALRGANIALVDRGRL